MECRRNSRISIDAHYQSNLLSHGTYILCIFYYKNSKKLKEFIFKRWWSEIVFNWTTYGAHWSKEWRIFRYDFSLHFYDYSTKYLLIICSSKNIYNQGTHLALRTSGMTWVVVSQTDLLKAILSAESITITAPANAIPPNSRIDLRVKCNFKTGPTKLSFHDFELSPNTLVIVIFKINVYVVMAAVVMWNIHKQQINYNIFHIIKIITKNTFIRLMTN